MCGLVRELKKCGASPECVENVLKCTRKVNPDQLTTPVLYKEALQQVLKAAIHSYQDIGPGGSPTEGQDSDSVRMIFSAVSQHETGGCVLLSYWPCVTHSSGSVVVVVVFVFVVVVVVSLMYRGSLVASKDLISIMTPFCKDNSNPLYLRKL